MINPASLAFDIDGVIADTMSLFLDIARDDYDVDGISYADITCYNLADCIAMESAVIDAVVRRILDGHYTVPLRPIRGAPEVLARIGKHHSPVLFVTARPYVGPIRDWLCDVLPLCPESIDVVATATHELKAGVLQDRNISCFVEDRLETCYLLQDAGIVPVLFKQPWNREFHPFLEIENWDELDALIDF